MCGICGKIDIQGWPVPQELLIRMSGALSHRGPDDSGIYESHGPLSVGLGHRRLSIVDLSTSGRQPMSNENKTIWLVFNGEIYNHRELRAQLEAQGHRFSSRTDSEVILHLYEEDGIRCLEKLNGMFAFCLWDSRSQSVYLCRDRAGLKPLVYAWDGQSLVFASEIRSLLCDASIPTQMDEKALDLYLTFNYIPAPYTIYKHIRKLEPATYLELKGGRISLQKYWDPAIVIPASLAKRARAGIQDFKTAQEILCKLLEDSVRLQCQADVPLGAFLSGGVDSSIIVGLMSKLSSSKVKTFSIGFPDMSLLDETHYSRQVADLYQTDHTEIRLQSRDVLPVFKDLLGWFDEPFADSSAIPTFIVSQQTSLHVKVALSGDGGDELFAGYRMYTGEYWHSRYRSIPHLFRKGLIEPLIKNLPDSRDQRALEHLRRLKKFMEGSADRFEDRFFLWNQVFTQDFRCRLLRTNPSTDSGRQIIESLLGRYSGDDINRMLYCDFKNSLPNDMLAKVDAMGMKNSLEVRVPLLDHRIAELMFQLPGEWKLKGTQGKYIFVETFKDLLPKALLHRPKAGFEVPISRWLKGDLKFLINEHLSETKVRQQGIFCYAAIKNLIDDLLQNRRDTSWQLWNLIVFQAWNSR